jgi:glutamate---cysteine ligase / carboxylate-amine ligase
VTINFTSNARPTIGVEMELHLIDAVTGELVSASSAILAEMGAGHPGGDHPKAKHELFQSTVEIITGVCETPAEAADDLRATLAELRACAERRGLTIMSSGTHPFGLARDQIVSPHQRYVDLIDDLQWPARRMLICGMHVHVGVKDGSRAIRIIGELLRHHPLFLALSSSSPYFESEDSGMASARTKVFEGLPTAGLPPLLADWADFEAFMSTLLESGCISSIREVWWDIRPHPDFGTVEFRMCDATPTVRETIALAALAQTLVEWTDRRIDEGTLPPPPRDWTIRENRWLASRYGIDAELIVEHPDSGRPERRPVRQLVTELLEELRPVAAELGNLDQLADLAVLLDVGSGTQRQRKVVEEGGTLSDVVDHLVAELAADTITGSPAAR